VTVVIAVSSLIVALLAADGEGERLGFAGHNLSRLEGTLSILLNVARMYFPPRDRITPLASPHEVDDDFLQLVETQNITGTNRCRRPAALKLNVAALHHRMVGDSHQIGRAAVHTTVLDAAEISTNPDHDLKIASAAKLGHERCCITRMVKELIKIIVT
jgi:hypothetical protein